MKRSMATIASAFLIGGTLGFLAHGICRKEAPYRETAMKTTSRQAPSVPKAKEPEKPVKSDIAKLREKVDRLESEIAAVGIKVSDEAGRGKVRFKGCRTMGEIKARLREDYEKYSKERECILRNFNYEKSKFMEKANALDLSRLSEDDRICHEEFVKRYERRGKMLEKTFSWDDETNWEDYYRGYAEWCVGDETRFDSMWVREVGIIISQDVHDMAVGMGYSKDDASQIAESYRAIFEVSTMFARGL